MALGYTFDAVPQGRRQRAEGPTGTAGMPARRLEEVSGMCPLIATAAVVILSGATADAAQAPSKPKTHSVAGTVEAYDAAAHALTLKTAKGAAVFKLGEDTKVWNGAKSVTEEQLVATVGMKAKVKYTESDGTRTATTVRVTMKKTN
jgi:phage baseplate assembly protein gpV